LLSIAEVHIFGRISLDIFPDAFSVLCPLIAIINVTGVPSKNSLVQKERRQVWDITQAYFGLVSSVRRKENGRIRRGLDLGDSMHSANFGDLDHLFSFTIDHD